MRLAYLQTVGVRMYSHDQMAAVIEHVRQEAEKVVLHQPKAHAFWQFRWRDAKFRNALTTFVDSVYQLNVDGLDDDQLQLLESVMRAVLHAIEIHTSRLGDGLRETVDREYFKTLVKRLKVAIDGVEQGLAPDPSKRPSRAELLDRLAAGLRRANLG